MKIHVLAENTTCSAELAAEHGLSLLIETNGQLILFDTGASGAFADNAEHMGLDLQQVDAVVLSHGHYDHGGGLERFLSLNSQAPVYVSPHAFEPHFNAAGKDIGLSHTPADHPRIRRVHDNEFRLAAGITLHRALDMPPTYPPAGEGMSTIVKGERVADDFRHEQYLLVEEAGKRVLVSGCSHRGVLNIATYFRPDVLVGGFHFMKADPIRDADRLHHAADILQQLPTRYYTGHCTGEAAGKILATRLGDRLHFLHTGLCVEP